MRTREPAVVFLIAAASLQAAIPIGDLTVTVVTEDGKRIDFQGKIRSLELR